MKDIELIIFDLDGTLVDSVKDIAEAVNHTLRKLGVEEKSHGEIKSLIGTGAEDLIKKSIDTKTDCCLEDALSLMSEYYRGHSLDNTRLFPGVRETLDYFAQKRKAIITNRQRGFAVQTLKGLGIYDYFEEITGGDNLGCMKPSSCPLEGAMHGFGVKRSKTIMVGDMNIDILAGKKAGVATCGVTYGIGEKEDILEAGPDFVIDSITGLKDIIRK